VLCDAAMRKVVCAVYLIIPRICGVPDHCSLPLKWLEVCTHSTVCGWGPRRSPTARIRPRALAGPALAGIANAGFGTAPLRVVDDPGAVRADVAVRRDESSICPWAFSVARHHRAGGTCADSRVNTLISPVVGGLVMLVAYALL
jgi:hypothetical protein